ncbi:MAG: transcription factor S [Candidatus Aenigmarchaeota archaeon]|nr:transcription factor S [Candidatus Aenigmarchaeota archaeon]
MEFCPKCGLMCSPRKVDGKMVLVCRKCGKKITKYKPAQISETVKRKPKDEIVLISEKKEALPKARIKCRKCGNMEACWWLQQMRSGDEPPTTFYKCTKCGHCWREY